MVFIVRVSVRWSASAVGIDEPAEACVDASGGVHWMVSFSGCASAVGIDQPALAGADAGSGAHRTVSLPREGQPLGSTVAPCPARTWLVAFMVHRWGRCPGPCRPGRGWWRASDVSFFSEDLLSRWGRCPSPGRRGRASSCSSWFSPVDSCQPFGSIPPPLPAGRCVEVLIVDLRSRRVSAVGVHRAAGSGADAGRGAHRRSPVSGWRQPLGSMAPPVPARTRVMVLICRSPVLAVPRVSRWGLPATPRRRGGVWCSAWVLRCSAFGVHAGAAGGAYAGARLHQGPPAGRPLGSINPPSPARMRVVVRMETLSSVARQPLGLIIPPSPARTRVVVLIGHLLSGAAGQPSGSISTPSAARTRVVVFIASLRSWTSAVGVHDGAFAGADAGCRLHRDSPGSAVGVDDGTEAGADVGRRLHRGVSRRG